MRGVEKKRFFPLSRKKILVNFCTCTLLGIESYARADDLAAYSLPITHSDFVSFCEWRTSSHWLAVGCGSLSVNGYSCAQRFPPEKNAVENGLLHVSQVSLWNCEQGDAFITRDVICILVLFFITPPLFSKPKVIITISAEIFTNTCQSRQGS